MRRTPVSRARGTRNSGIRLPRPEGRGYHLSSRKRDGILAGCPTHSRRSNVWVQRPGAPPLSAAVTDRVESSQPTLSPNPGEKGGAPNPREVGHPEISKQAHRFPRRQDKLWSRPNSLNLTCVARLSQLGCKSRTNIGISQSLCHDVCRPYGTPISFALLPSVPPSAARSARLSRASGAGSCRFLFHRRKQSQYSRHTICPTIKLSGASGTGSCPSLLHCRKESYYSRHIYKPRRSSEPRLRRWGAASCPPRPEGTVLT